jgi:hypothetical protein
LKHPKVFQEKCDARSSCDLFADAEFGQAIIASTVAAGPKVYYLCANTEPPISFCPFCGADLRPLSRA